MAILDRITDFGQSLGQSVAQKSGEFVETSKITMNIRKKEKDIRSLKMEIGTLVYEMYKNGQVFDETIQDRCAEIDEGYAYIEEQEQERESVGLEDLNVEVVDAEVDDEDFIIDDDVAELDDIVKDL